MSGFFSNQRPIESPRERRTTIRRKQIEFFEKLQAESTRPNTPATSPNKPTVRLVKTSPSYDRRVGSDSEDGFSDVEDKQLAHRLVQDDQQVRREEGGAIKSGYELASHGARVSDASSLAKETHAYLRPASISSPAIDTASQHRRDASSGNLSISSTLRDGESKYGQASLRSESRFSQGTTVRGTPTPYEQEQRRAVEEEQEDSTELTIETPEEPAAGRQSTVRPVDITSDNGLSLHRVRPEPSEVVPSSPPSQPAQFEWVDSSPARSPGLPEDVEDTPLQRYESSDIDDTVLVRPISFRSTYSADSTPATANVITFGSSTPARPNIIRVVSSPPLPQVRRTQQDPSQSDSSALQTSSPNFVAYRSDSIRPSSPRYRSQSTASFESIPARLQQSATVRPDTAKSAATDSSWATTHRPSSEDTLPPLEVPRKRLRHMQASDSLSSTLAAMSENVAEEEGQRQGYWRHHYSSHLSTIASESEGQSRRTSQQLSHFSIGSGVTTVDSASASARSPAWLRERESAQTLQSPAVSHLSPVESISSPGEPGDMTLGVFSDETAKPEPLFRPKATYVPFEDRKYDGRLPPIPPIPQSRDSDEGFDTLSELQAPLSLREKRSARSLKRASTSTPSWSAQRNSSDTARFSHTSHQANQFPTWAKVYYGQGADLMSASQVSLALPKAVLQQYGPPSGRNSEWTQRSITSRGISEPEPPSPASSRFLPRIFRPRTRKRWSDNVSSKRNSRPDEATDLDSFAILNASHNASVQTFNTHDHNHQTPASIKSGSLTFTPSLHDQPRQPLDDQQRSSQNHYPHPRALSLTSSQRTPHLHPTKRAQNTSTNPFHPPSLTETLRGRHHNARYTRQIVLFAVGFLCPVAWFVAAFLSLPERPARNYGEEGEEAGEEKEGAEGEGQKGQAQEEQGDQVLAVAMRRLAAREAQRERERGEREWRKARWWRGVNRGMAVVGVGVCAAVVSLFFLFTSVFRCILVSSFLSADFASLGVLLWETSLFLQSFGLAACWSLPFLGSAVRWGLLAGL